MDVIARNYLVLKNICGYCNYGLFCSKSYEDIFQDTILFVSQDEEAAFLKTDKEFVEYFHFRFNMIKFQTIHDNKLLKENRHADLNKMQKKEERE